MQSVPSSHHTYQLTLHDPLPVPQAAAAKDLDSPSGSAADSLPEKTVVSREVVFALVDAYLEIRNLVFDNFYGKFCQSSEYRKISKRYVNE